MKPGGYFMAAVVSPVTLCCVSCDRACLCGSIPRVVGLEVELSAQAAAAVDAGSFLYLSCSTTHSDAGMSVRGPR